MSQKKDISDFSIDELKRLATEAGLEARDESLKAGIEIMSEDEDGHLVYEKLDENGKVVTRPAPKKDRDNERQAFKMIVVAGPNGSGKRTLT